MTVLPIFPELGESVSDGAPKVKVADAVLPDASVKTTASVVGYVEVNATLGTVNLA